MPGHAKTLNPQQLAFAQAVALGVNGVPVTISEAAKHAGYRDSTRHTPGRIAKLPIVNAEIERLRAHTRATMLHDAETWDAELRYQYERVKDATNKDGDPVAADALSALDKAAKRGNLYEQHESSSRATEVLSALAGIGARMIASRQGDKAPVTVAARISGLLHNTEERAHAPSRTRVLTVGEQEQAEGRQAPPLRHT